MTILTASTATPRRVHRLVLLRVVCAAFALSGCVSNTAYQQATSATEVEQEAHRRTSVKLDAAEAKLAKLQSERDELNESLTEREGAVAEGEVEVEKTRQERDQQAALVNQLRGELERVGADLKVYAGEKGELSTRLATAEAHEAQLEAKVGALEKRLVELREDADNKQDVVEKLDSALEELARLQAESQESEQASESSEAAAEQEAAETAEADEAGDTSDGAEAS